MEDQRPTIQTNQPISSENLNLDSGKPPPSRSTLIKSLPLKMLALIAAIVILFLIVLRILGIDIYNTKSDQQITLIQPSTSPTPMPTVEANEDLFDSLPDGIMRYTSPTLGITFTYLTIDGETKFSVTRKGNKVCITYDKNDPGCSKGQYVEVFTKNSTQTLNAAIEEQILKDYDKNKCFAEDHPGKKSVGALTFSEISYPPLEDPEAPFYGNEKNCPRKYSKTNGLRYFMADSSVPNKFTFFNIGQYAIHAEGNLTWQDTFKFTEEKPSPIPTSHCGLDINIPC